MRTEETEAAEQVFVDQLGQAKDMDERNRFVEAGLLVVSANEEDDYYSYQFTERGNLLMDFARL